MKRTSMIIVSLVLAVYLSACGQDVPTSGNISDVNEESSDSQDMSTSDNSSDMSEESENGQDISASDNSSDTSEESSESQDTPASDDDSNVSRESSDSQEESVTHNETESSEAEEGASATSKEFATSFTTDKNVYNNYVTGDIAGILPTWYETTE